MVFEDFRSPLAPLQIRQVQSTASGRGEGQSPTLADPTNKGGGGFGCYGFVRAEGGAELFRLHFDYVADPPATGCLAPEWQDVFTWRGSRSAGRDHRSVLWSYEILGDTRAGFDVS